MKKFLGFSVFCVVSLASCSSTPGVTKAAPLELLGCPLAAAAQAPKLPRENREFKLPESVVYQLASKSLFVSNQGADGWIYKLGLNGKIIKQRWNRPHADTRAGTNDRNLDHEIVEVLWCETSQYIHLRAAFDLEYPHRVSTASGSIYKSQKNILDLRFEGNAFMHY